MDLLNLRSGHSQSFGVIFKNYYFQMLLICLGFLLCSCHKAAQSVQSPIKDNFFAGETDSLLKISEILRKSAPDSALLFAKRALELSEAGNNSKGAANALNYMGIAFFYLGGFDSSMSYNERALKIFKEIKDSIRYADVLVSIGNVFQDRGNYIESEKYYKKAYNEFLALNYNRGVLKAMINLSNSLREQGKYNSALDYLFKALSIANGENDIKSQALSSENIGLIYFDLNNYDKAYINYLQAINLYIKLNDKAKLANIYNTIGSLYLVENKNDSSMYFYQKALSIANEIRNLSLLSDIKNNIGEWYYQHYEYNKALENFNSAQAISRQQNDSENFALTLMGQGLTYLKINRLELALPRIIEAYKISKSIHSPDIKKESSKTLSEAYEKLNDYKNALVYYKEYKSIADSSLNRQNIEKVTSLQMKYEFELEQKQLEHIQIQKDLKHEVEIRQIKTRRLLILLISIALLTSLSISFLLFRNRQKSKIERLKTEINKNMQRLLGQQMNPHFIFNTLKSIQNFILKNDVKQSNLFLTRFAGLIRKTLENSQNEFISLADEIESLQLYAQLENLRLNDKFVFTVQIDKKIDPDLTKVPSLFFQPYIENAIWHGVSAMEGKGEISLTIAIDSDRLYCIIEDNGIGRQRKNLENVSNHSSLGTSITEKRISLLNSLYKTNIRPEISNGKDIKGNLKGTRVEFTLPYIN